MFEGTLPWAWVIAAGVLVGVIVAIRYPASRRWFTALAMLTVFGTAAFFVLLAGAVSQMDVGGGVPPAAIIGSAVLAITGLVVAGFIVFARRRSSRT